MKMLKIQNNCRSNDSVGCCMLMLLGVKPKGERNDCRWIGRNEAWEWRTLRSGFPQTHVLTTTSWTFRSSRQSDLDGLVSV